MRVLVTSLALCLAFVPLGAGASGTSAQNSAYVVAAYQMILGHAPDGPGSKVFSDQLTAGTMTRDQVVTSLMMSAEFRTHEVAVMYQHYLHRHADAGSSQLVAALGAGELSSSIAARLIGSPEYYALAGGNNDSYVRKIYSDILHRTPDNVALHDWSGLIAQGTSRESVANMMLTSAEGAPPFLAFLFTNVANGSGTPHGKTLYESVLIALEPHPAQLMPAKPIHTPSPAPRTR
jgi:hypothetical protein